ncbi:LysR family transcriptional regulator [Alsobacter metallidurans]|uniref:LysR family transcriptional regulator n=1 Tax=Alsobacter metallidurans TaxID=340221 RepID=A0A917MJN3_9HYPH|nr:LysR family transcriptional regulator [Alsobacter metallidurans]GGH18891.1 LysR family transcriptional regulator [Alsobacter metallidurans]
MLKLDCVSAFVCVAEAGSITAAAQRLGLAKSVVSERLAELEQTLGAQLVQRTTRRSTLTENGRIFLARARRLLSDAEDAVAELAQQGSELIGPLRLSAPVSFGALRLAEPLFAFMRQHPRIELSLELDDHFVDPAADGFDAVVRHGPVLDRRLIAHRLASSMRHLVASPDYLAEAGPVACLEDLSVHRAILYSRRGADWRFEGPDGATVIRPRTALRLNNGLMMRSAALAGLGIALLPSFMVHEDLTAGRLVVIDAGAAPQGAELFVAHPLDRATSSKIKALVTHLRAAFGNPSFWEHTTRQQPRG